MKSFQDLKERLLKCGSLREAAELLVKTLRARVKHYNWVGVYMVEEGDLVLWAWNGEAPTEHVRIEIGKGICGLAAATGTTVIVPDVSKAPEYLRCFLNTRSEIVVPLKQKNKVIGEIDIDSDTLAAFEDPDRWSLEAIADVMVEVWERDSKKSLAK